MADSSRATSRKRASDLSSEQAAILDSVSQYVFAKDLNLVYTYCNPKYAAYLGLDPSGVVGKTDLDLFPREFSEKFRSDDRRVLQDAAPASIIARWSANGQESTMRMIKVPLETSGSVSGVLSLVWSTALEHVENEEARTRAEQARERAEETLARQAAELLEVSTPVLELWDGIVAVPLIGTLDSARTQQMTERLLEAIVQTRSSVAVLDITGVPTVDTQTGRHLLETIAATRMMGAEIVLTGVRPAIAQTLVHLGIDLTGVTTRPSLAAGLRVALGMIGLQVTPKA